MKETFHLLLMEIVSRTAHMIVMVPVVSTIQTHPCVLYFISFFDVNCNGIF